MGDWVFKRHLDQEFIDALQKARSDVQSWWSEVVKDRDLIIGLRGNYLNVYYRGQSLFRVTVNSGRLAASTHPKYLVDPKLSKPVSFDGRNFDIGKLADTALLAGWSPEALSRLKKAAKLYSGPEKTGCHSAVVNNKRLLDVEIAFSRDPATLAEEERRIPRIDFALLESEGDGYAVRFWEAKAYGNSELGSMSNQGGVRTVLGQIQDYESTIAKHADELANSYAKVCQNLSAIYSGTDRYSSDNPIAKIAQNPDLLMRVLPQVHLFIFGFDGAQKKGAKKSFDEFESILGKDRLRIIGLPGGAFPT